MKSLLSFLILAAIMNCIKAQDYSHKDQSAWLEEPNWQCNGDLQSPIELDRDNADKARGILLFANYDVPFKTPPLLWNNGHSVEVQIPPNTAYCTGFWLTDKYILDSVHFHWGLLNFYGSEHVVDGKRHAAELHLVHYNSKYGTKEEAFKQKDGLLVLGILFEVFTDPPNGFAGLNRIVDALPSITSVGASIELNNFLISDILYYADFNTFFNYLGSLTTPPCSENVNWFVSPNPIPITSDELDAFRSLLDPDGKPLHNNYRCLQPRNKRNILFYTAL